MPRKYDDHDDEGDPPDAVTPLSAAQLARAKSRVVGPAVLLTVCGVLGLGVFGFHVVTGLRDPVAKFKRLRGGFENDPLLDERERQGLKAINDDLEKSKPFVTLARLAILACGAPPLLTVAGAVSMLRFSSRGVAKTGAFAALLPCTGCCYVLGIGGGVWSLAALGDRDVKAAFAAGGRVTSRRRDGD